MPTAIEIERDADFNACPILQSYIATMLEDLQFSENDEACEEEREPRDTGTIYTLPASTYEKAKRDCEAFYCDNLEAIEEAGELEPGQEGYRYAKNYMTADLVGYYFYMVRVGHGVDFTDGGTPGEAHCLAKLSESARSYRGFDAYFGDDGEVYTI